MAEKCDFEEREEEIINHVELFFDLVVESFDCRFVVAFVFVVFLIKSRHVAIVDGVMVFVDSIGV